MFKTIETLSMWHQYTDSHFTKIHKIQWVTPCPYGSDWAASKRDSQNDWHHRFSTLD